MDTLVHSKRVDTTLVLETRVLVEGHEQGLILTLKKALRAMEHVWKVRSFLEKNTGHVVLKVTHSTNPALVADKLLEFKDKGVDHVALISTLYAAG